MKRILIISLALFAIMVSSKAQGLPGPVLSSGLYFNNDELTIKWETRQDAWNPGEQAYEKASLRFFNNTNNKMRVKYKVLATLVRYGKQFEYENTIYIEPNGYVWDEVITHHKNLHAEHETIVNIKTFKLINYAIEPVSYKTEW